jgi:hypothetical protein
MRALRAVSIAVWVGIGFGCGSDTPSDRTSDTAGMSGGGTGGAAAAGGNAAGSTAGSAAVGGSGATAGAGPNAGRGGAGGAGVTGGAARGGTGGTAGSGGSASPGRPPQLCTSPLNAADTSKPTMVIGTGTAASCTEASLRAAVMQGGVITFNCGPAETTIKITQTLVAPSSKDTTIDGNDKIVLDGGGTTQTLKANSSNFRANDHVLRVQRLVMRGGREMGSGFKARDGDKTCAWGYKSGGGGAINVRDVVVQIWGVTFIDNHGPELGPDVAGGAIYAVGAKTLTVANSVFSGNSASNGGAIGLLHTSAQLYNVLFENNKATGLLANFAGATGCPTFNHEEQGGAGGLGGAFYADGQDPGDTFCGVQMSGNTSGDLGGAVFRSAYWGLIADSPKQEFNWDQTTLENNQSGKGGGAGYLNNALFTLKRSHFSGNVSKEDGGALKLTGLTLHADDVEFANNKAATAGGGIAQWDEGPEGAGTATNIKFSGNKPNDAAGVFPK